MYQEFFCFEYKSANKSRAYTNQNIISIQGNEIKIFSPCCIEDTELNPQNQQDRSY